MSDFVGPLTDASDYLNSTKIDIPTGKFDVDPETGTVTAQTQAYSLKEIICSLLAGNGIKLPNLQICLKINIGRLIPEIPAGLEDLQEALEEAEKALDEFIAHTNIDNALGRLNAAVAEFAAIANMINFCGTPVIPRAIPNVLKDSMGSFLGAGKSILDTLGTMADSDVGGCIGADGNFTPDLFTSGLLKQLGDNFSNLLGMPASLKAQLISDLNGFKTDIENLIKFENNFGNGSTDSTGGSVFAPNDRINTGVGMAVDPNLTLTKSQQYASTIQALYNSLKGYPVDAAGNDIFYYLLEPEILAKLQNNGDPSIPLSEREPVYDHCNRIIGYTETSTQTVVEQSVGGAEQSMTQPGVTGLTESGVVLTNPPATTTNLGATVTVSGSSGGSVDLSAYSTTVQMQTADAAVVTAFTTADTTATTDRAAIRTEFASADTSLQTSITNNASNIATNTSAITALQSGAGYPSTATFTNLTTSNLTINGSGNVVFSAVDLELNVTNRAKVTGGPFRLARMTTTEINAIASPVGGDMIFNTTTSKFQGYDGTVWADLN